MRDKAKAVQYTLTRRSKLLAVNRPNLLQYLSTHHCVDCGNADARVLEFDHIDKDTKSYEIGVMLNTFKWEKILTEINKCEVRCANCHKIRSGIQFNWWRTKSNPSSNPN